jgi:hypothetical protein
MKNKKRGLVGHNGSDACDKWAEAAMSSDAQERMNIPLYVLMNEAVDLARFAEHYWAAKRDAKGKVTQPGLELAARKEGLSENPTADLLGLQEALQTAQTRYLLTVEPESDSPGDRGEIILGELRATLEYFFDDGVQNEDDVRLARLEEQHAQPLAHRRPRGALSALCSVDFGTPSADATSRTCIPSARIARARSTTSIVSLELVGRPT